jgi:tetratricopeptide (TPR) repeat protein
VRFAFVVCSCLALVAPTVLTPEAALAGDFDPSGRRKPKKPGGAKPGGAKPGGAKPTPGAGAPKVDEDGKKPEALIARYTAIVLAQPATPFPLQRLAQLHRDRDGNLKKLVEDFEKRAAASGDEGWAATVALAGLLKIDGQQAEAVAKYEAAIAAKPKESAPVLALAQLEFDRGNKAEARTHYEKALPLLKESADVEQTTRLLMQISLDLKDVEAARKHHASLVKGGQGSIFVQAELGREMMTRGQFSEAETEFREVVKAAAGDNRAVAPALKDLGNALAKQKKTTEALDTLKKALGAAGAASGIRAEILGVMTDAFRADGKLAELIEILEKDGARDFQRLRTLAGLYEETGNVDKALVTYRAALAADGSNVDTRVRVVHLLQTAGKLEEAIKESEALVRAAPQNPEFVFELCETLIQRGDRPKALKVLKELEGRTQEPDVLAAVSNFYERVEEKDRALALLQRVANSQSSDPTFLVDLGDRYYQQGDKKKAAETWLRIRTLVPNKAQAAATLGRVYLDHDMADEALAAFREAVAADTTHVHNKKALAIALERTAPGSAQTRERFAEAVTIWEELLLGAKSDPGLAREARTHIVSIWSVQKELAARVAPLAARFAADPPDLEAGRLLAEVQRKLGKLPEADATLGLVSEKDPGDESSLLALERVRVQRGDLAGAIEVLQKLVQRNDKSARQYYQRMSQYSAELYLDDDAITYAAKAVELAPEDAHGHQALGDKYRKRNDYDKAIAEYRAAIARNDRLFPVYFALAELLLAKGDSGEADKLFRRVARSSPDEELLSRAARMSMQINLGKGSLESLERELLPVAVGNPQKPIYRRLLIEIYGAMTLPMVQEVKLDKKPEDVKRAKAELAAVGSRALKPLLDALADDRESQQRIAIEILAYVQNKSAAATLFNFATGQADKSLRTRAMIAVGALRDSEMLPKLSELLAPKDRGSAVGSDELKLAAAWAVARLGGTKSEELLVELLEAGSPDVRGMAALGLGLSKNRKHAARLTKLARDAESGPATRTAALLALGKLVEGGAPVDTASLEVVSEALRASDKQQRRAALVTAARLVQASPSTTTELEAALSRALGEAILDADPLVVEDATRARALLFERTAARVDEPLPTPDGKLTLRGAFSGFSPPAPTDDRRLQVLTALISSLKTAAESAVALSPERASSVADALAGGPVLAPFAKAAAAADEAGRKRAETATSEILAAVVPGFVMLLGHPDAQVQGRAARVLARAQGGSAERGLAAALEAGTAEQRRAILSATTSISTRELRDEIGRLASGDESWAIRARAVTALSLKQAPELARDSVLTLRSIAAKDEYALVRESALRALSALAGADARAFLEERASSDPEERVRETARALATSAPPSGEP